MRKHCTACNTEKDYSQFYLDKRSGNPRSKCKQCMNTYTLDKRANDPTYAEATREAGRRHDAKRSKTDKKKLQRIEWYHRKKGTPEYKVRMAAIKARYRSKVALSMDELDRDLSKAYRLAIANDPCYYCGKHIETMHTDHYYPIAKGGTDHWWNLVRACQHCNCSKSDTCGTAYALSK